MDSTRVPFSQLSERIADRTLARQFAQEFIEANDHYRAMAAKQLYDSTAQLLGTLILQLSATIRQSPLTPEDLQERLRKSHEIAARSLDEVRQLSHLIYPRVLDDLGLEVALQRLARETNETPEGSVHVSVRVENARRIARHLEIALFGVAQAAVETAARHDVRVQLAIWLRMHPETADLEIRDDVGIFKKVLFQERIGNEFSVARERLLLAGGTLTMKANTNGGVAGAAMLASVPLSSTAFRQR